MSIPSATSAPTDEPPPERRRPSWRVWLVLMVVLAAGVGVLGLTGGLQRVGPPRPAPPPMVAVAETVDGGPWRVGVTNAAAATDLGLYKAKDGNWLLAIVVKVDALGPDNVPGSQLPHIVSLPGFVGLVAPEPMAIALVRDGSRVAFISPGLPERVAFMFEVKAGTPVPQRVIVALSGYTPELSWDTRRYEWRDLAVRAQVTVDVANKMPASTATPTTTPRATATATATPRASAKPSTTSIPKPSVTPRITRSATPSPTRTR